MADHKKPRCQKSRNDNIADIARAKLEYDPDTGVMRWKANQHKKYAGKTAGCLDTRGYRYVSIDGIKYLTHRVAWIMMTGEWPTHEIDHIDCDKSNMRWINLREATPSENRRNRPSDNPSGYKGIYRHRNKWAAHICVHNVSRYIGIFRTPEEAHAAYRRAATELHGEFARFK